MAEKSKFLKWQDANSNMLPDECPNDGPPIVNKCLPCAPNPWATVPKWKKLTQTEPFLNEKLCKYQISFLTKDITLRIAADRPEDGDIVKEWVEELFNNYLDNWSQNAADGLPFDWLKKEPSDPGQPRPGVIEALLSWKNKAINEESIKKIKENVEFTEYYLAPNPGSYVQLLYSVPYEILENLEDWSAPDEPEPEPGDITVKMNVHDMVMNNIKVRKGLYMYNRYNKVYQAIEGAVLKFKKDGRIFNLEDYGEYWPWDQDSHLAGCMSELDDWLNGYDINIPNTGWPHWFTESALEVEFRVTGKYKLKSIKVWTDRCNERPIYFGRRKVRNLKRRKSWKDPTAVAFFLQMADIERELSARVEKPWLEVLKMYTYPEIEASQPINVETMPEAGDNLGNNIPSCIANALGNEFKELGQDIFDEVFSIGDAVAYAFHKNLCRYSAAEVSSDLADVGINFGIKPKIADDITDDKTTIWAAATMQAYATVDPRDQVFANFCLRMLSIKNGSPLQMLDDIWANGFERIKICGLFDLLLGAVECLTKGISLQDALMVMLKNAFKAMTAEEYGKLFVGLEPSKQDELDKLVRKNLESGKTFNHLINNVVTDYKTDPGTTSTNTAPAKLTPETSQPFFGKIKFTKPWENKEFVKSQKDGSRDNGMGNMVPPPGVSASRSGSPPTPTRRTLAQKLDFGKVAKDELDPNTVMDAYIIALLELYSDNLLFLLDRLNDFPGAQIISALLSTLDCPMPPLFNPGISDFLKSIVFPFCRGKSEITLPYMEHTAIWWPKLMDIWGLIYELLKHILIQLIIKIIVLILVKICQIIGDAICKALEVVGTAVASLPSVLAGNKNLFNVIKESICGKDASDEEIESVVVQLVADLGVGGQALSNPERALSFAEDLGGATTQTELLSAMSGDPSVTFLTIADQIVENGYPDYRDALPNERAIARFFKNIGFLVPAEMRHEIKTGLGWLGPTDETPVNPSMCATPEDIEAFKSLRCELLEGRATPEQCEEMFNKFRGGILEDLDEVTHILQQGIGNTIADQLPPIVSDPGCDNGIMPYETDSMIKSATTSADSDMKKLQLAYSRDMLGGQSGFFGGGGDSKWGLLNMMLCDTLGNPYTVHQSKTENDSDFVDFYTGWGDDQDWVQKIMDESDNGLMPAGLSSVTEQRGAYPKYVGEWLMYQYQMAGGEPSQELKDLGLTGVMSDLAASISFVSTNTPQAKAKWGVSFDNLGFGGGLFGDQDVDFTDLPQMGYKTRPVADYDNEKVWFIKAPRKDEPDIKLVFKDNAKGYRFGPNQASNDNEYPAWNYQYRVSAFFSDMESSGPGSVTAYRNRADDNIRVYISDWYNMGGAGSNFGKMMSPTINEKRAQKDIDEEPPIMVARKYEFMGVDNGLDSLHPGALAADGSIYKYTMSDFPSLSKSFERQTLYAPQINMLYDLFRLNGTETSRDMIKHAYENFMETQFKNVARQIGDNKDMWLFGAAVDDLDLRDFDYVCPDGWKQPSTADIDEGQKFKISRGGAPLQYAFMEVPDYDSDGERDGSRYVTNDDAILGMSRNEWVNRQRKTHPQKTRVFMLDPGKYGGTYSNPPMYARPMRPTGWTGVIDIIYPENSMCEPKITDIIEFSDIKKKIDATYPSIPEDTRLRGDPDCVVEVPYNRILNRLSKASIQGLVSATIRMYSSVHFIKCLPLFTKFAPLFPSNYSNVFSSYIIENIEAGLRSSGGNFLSPFKDDEFWLAFLEQCVQTYARRVEDGDIAEDAVPQDVKDAMIRLNNYQERFNYPFDEDLSEAKDLGDAAWYETLKSFREEKNLEAILKTQYDAKLIMKELVNEELQVLSNKFMQNLKVLDIMPDVTDIGFYYMTEFCTNSKNLVLEGRMIEKPVGLPHSGVDASGTGEWLENVLPGVTYSLEAFVVPEDIEDLEDPELIRMIEDGSAKVGWPGPFYTHGGEFSARDGTDYVGYYHGTKNDVTGQDEYFTGEHLTNNDPDKQIRAMSDKLIVGMEKTRLLDEPDEDGKAAFEVKFEPLGDVDDWDNTSATTEAKPFYLKKYISINGEKYSQAEATTLIKANGTGNLSQFYPGTMKLIYDSDGDEVGIDGELGVKYGLEMAMDLGTAGTAVFSRVEISALDIPTSAFVGIQENSTLLYCLIAKMREDQGFILTTEYAFSMKKVLGVMAIYQDLGMLPSIGEVTVEAGALHGDLSHYPSNHEPYDLAGDHDVKPGGYAIFDLEPVEVTYDHWLWGESTEEVPTIKGAKVSFTPGWVAENDRNGFWASLFFRKWDEWDQVPLRNTSSLLKKVFQVHYRSRNWDMSSDESDNIVLNGINILREKFRIQPGMAFLPWWRKNRLRPNPFNAEGELCKKKD